MFNNVRLMCLAAMAAIAFSTAHAASKMIAVEDALETDSNSISFPSNDAGEILRTHCHDCNNDPLRLTSDSQYFIGTTSTTFAELGKLLKRSKQPHMIVIFYRFSDHTVTRFVVSD